MPIYEYVCPDCKAKFELLRPLSRADEAALCPHCQQPGRRVLSRFACFSTDASGQSSPVGGSSCSSCGSSGCTSCGM